MRELMVCGMGVEFVDDDREWRDVFRRWKSELATAAVITNPVP